MLFAIDKLNDPDKWCEYRDIALSLALTTFRGVTYKITCSYEPGDPFSVPYWSDWEMSPANDVAFQEIALHDVPLWCREMQRKLKERIECFAVTGEDRAT